MKKATMVRPLIAVLCGLCLSACVPRQVAGYVSTHPAFRPSVGEASQVGPDLNGYSQVTVPKSGLIVAEGDDVVYGSVQQPRGASARGVFAASSKSAFPDVLERLLGVQVENRGYPGDTIAAGETRWADRSPGNLLIIAYGFSDAKAKTPVADFKAALDRLMASAHAQGAAIMLLTPAGFSDAKLSAAAEPYRQAMRDAQAKYGASLFALSTILASESPQPTDGSYETDKGYGAIAYTIAPYIAVAPPPKPASPSF